MRLTLGDKILIAALCLLNVLLFAKMGTGFGKGDWVVIEVDQKETRRLPLSEERIVHIQGKLGVMDIEIRDNRARILRSPCANKICIKSGFIQYADRLLACVPNRVVVRIEGETRHGVDAIVG